MSGFWTCHECGAEMYGFENCQFCGAHKGGGEAMTSTTELLKDYAFTLRRLEYDADKPGSNMTLGEYEAEEKKITDEYSQAIAATLGGGVKDCENLLWEFIGALDVADTTDADKKPIVSDYARHIAATLGTEINGDTSDGYHTFDELYYHRTALFACLVALQPRQMAFKSWKHSDGTMYEGFFIAGIYTSGGWCTYHCEAKWWPLFDCHEQEFAPEWDGHTPSDAIHRLMSDFLPSQDVSGEASE